jgi:hypothetical protein
MKGAKLQSASKEQKIPRTESRALTQEPSRSDDFQTFWSSTALLVPDVPARERGVFQQLTSGGVLMAEIRRLRLARVSRKWSLEGI